MSNKFLTLIFVAMATFLSSSTISAQTTDKDVIVIELTQTVSEFTTTTLNLKPGKYQFRIVNKGVDKDLGFAIQKAKDKAEDVMKTAVPNSFTTALVKKDEFQYTGVVELKKGEYVYSCPLNPTPHYTLNVN